MNFGLALNVAISLTFVFVLAALLASTINEIIAGVLRLRGVYLTKAIESLSSLGTDNRFSWGGVGGWLNSHLFQRSAEVTREADVIVDNAFRAGNRHLSANRGATAAAVRDAILAALPPNAQNGTIGAWVIATVTTAAGAANAVGHSVVDALQPAQGIAALQKHPLLVGTPSSLPSYVASRDFASALLAQLADPSAENLFADARVKISTLPDGDVKKTLLAFLSAGAADMDGLRTRIENWFDDSMERLSGIYKRSSQYVMLILGLGIAVAMNVDTVHLARAFWEEPAVSKAIGDSAAQFATSNGADYFSCKDPQAQPPCESKASFKNVQALIDQQNLPIGRADNADYFGCVPSADPKLPSPCDNRLWKFWTVMGWFITAFAISLGAQFWFGLLADFASLRQAGDKPAPTVNPS